MKNALLTAQKNITLLLVLALGIVMGYGQEKSKNAVFGSIGFGSSNNKISEGMGINGSVGFQRPLWKDRLRIVPSISFGTYVAGKGSDLTPTYFSSSSFKLNIN